MSAVKKSLILGTLVCATALAGCGGGDDGGGSGASAINPQAGAGGGTNPAAGAGGTNPAAGTGGTAGMISTTAGNGGMTGGVGVSGNGGLGGGDGGGGGGEPLMCSGGADIRTGSMCADAAEGWFAIKTKIDVWWQGTPVRDPGRGDIEVYLLGKLEDVCDDGSNGRGTIKACGTVLPPFTSDVACDAFQIQFPNEIWESPMMPRYTTTGSTTAFEPGGILTLNSALGLVGIDLMDATQDQPSGFPTAAQTGTFACEAGTGVQCFPDHDNDGKPGITIQLRNDAATYVGPYQNGKCTAAGGTDYKYRGSPTFSDIGAGGGAGGGIRAIKVRIGLRTRLGGAGAIGADCMSGVGDSQADYLDSRAWECEVDPATLPPGDARMGGSDFACTTAEAQFVDENVPAYRVLAKGAMPGDSMPPLGWVLAGRDIPKTASAGPRSALVRLGSLSDPEPSCEAVRTAAYPAL